MHSLRSRFVLAVLTPALALSLAAGCDSGTGKKAAKPAAESRKTIGKTTQNVLKLSDALAKGGQIAEKGGDLGPSEGYLGTVTKAYRSSVAELAIGQAKQMLAIYDIQNNGPVKTYEEFMSGIIKKGEPDAMQLPMLPYYQEYAYDEANRELVVVEFPELKKEVEAQK